MIWDSTKDLEIRIQILSQRHDTRDIAAPVAVVRRGPHSHDVLRGEVVFVAFVDELMGASDELEVVYVVELRLC